MLTIFTNLTLDVYMWTCTIWMTLFAASRKLRGDCVQVFTNQLNFRPTSIGKHDSMEHMFPCAIDFKTNHPPIHLQWVGILGMATEPRHVISMGPRQPEVPGEASVCNDIKRVKDSIQKYISSLVPTVIINGIQREEVHNFNFLVVCLDSNLKWDGHIKLLASKLGKYSGILIKLKRYIPIDILWILYCSMVNSHLNYAILAWGFACSRLKKMQKRIIRIITCSKYNTHTSPLFKSLRILTLDDMVRLNTLKFYYKFLHSELPPYFYSFNIRVQGTRNSGQLQIEMTRTEYADKRLRIYLPTLVNDTPTDILAMITTHCLQDFTKNVKHYLFEHYAIVCSIPDCYICQRT